MPEHHEPDRISTGIDGLDQILHGGLITERGYLVTGAPGTGKSILGLHFLEAGATNEETPLYINLEESESDIRTNAATLGFDLDEVEFLDLSPSSEAFSADSSYEIFSADEVEGDDLKQNIRTGIENINPDRVFIDPITQLRDLTPDNYQFRKQVTALIEYLQDQNATVLFSSQAPDRNEDSDLQFLSDGSIVLEHEDSRRYIAVPKFRGSGMEGGAHSLDISHSGMTVSPKLSPQVNARDSSFESLSSGVPQVDDLLAGGIERGTVTVLSGPTGVGKTTLGTQFMKEAAERGERSVIYMFEEARETFTTRSKAINLPVQEMIDGDSLAIEEVPPFTYTPDQFAGQIKQEVEENDTQLVMIDGIDGYRNSLQTTDKKVLEELHALGRYLRNNGVTLILIDTADSVTGDFQATDSGTSYIADNILFLRYLELNGELRKAIGVLKMRMSDYERQLREFSITEDGIKVGEPLTGLRGILQGTPDFIDQDNPNRSGSLSDQERH